MRRALRRTVVSIVPALTFASALVPARPSTGQSAPAEPAPTVSETSAPAVSETSAPTASETSAPAGMLPPAPAPAAAIAPAPPPAAEASAAAPTDAASGAAPPPDSPSQAGRAAALGALRGEIEAGRERLAAYDARAQGLLDAMQAIDEAAEQLGIDVKRAEVALAGARRRLASARAAAAHAEERRDATRARLAQRVVALERAGDAGAVRALFAPGTLPERLSREALLRRLAARDARLLAQHRADLRAVDDAQAALASARDERDALRDGLAARRSALAQEKAARQVLLRRLRSDARRAREGLAELEAAARSLERTLAALGAAAGPPAPAAAAPVEPFARLRGRLPPPVDAPVRRGFGRVVDADFRTETFRKGVDFAAYPGENVRAVARGSVRFAGWFRGYGKMVILDHGDQYFSVSGHLDEIRVAVGDVVDAGSVIGSSGDTGSLSGTLLYFELRRGGEPLDPAAWLEPGRLVAPAPAGG